MKINLTIEITKEAREAIAHYFGDKTPTSRHNLAAWIRMTVESKAADLIRWTAEEKAERAERATTCEADTDGRANNAIARISTYSDDEKAGEK